MRCGVSDLRFTDGERVAQHDSVASLGDFPYEVPITPAERVFMDAVEFRCFFDWDLSPQLERAERARRFVNCHFRLQAASFARSALRQLAEKSDRRLVANGR